MTPKFAEGYVEVSERIADFRRLYPDGALQSEILTLPEAFAGSYIAVRAFAYRGPGDPRPGVGLAWEPVPGQTPYTRNSELQNCETSAWGRALIAVLAADSKRGIASADEVRSRQDPAPPSPPSRGGTGPEGGGGNRSSSGDQPARDGRRSGKAQSASQAGSEAGGGGSGPSDPGLGANGTAGGTGPVSPASDATPPVPDRAAQLARAKDIYGAVLLKAARARFGGTIFIEDDLTSEQLTALILAKVGAA